MQNAIWKGNPFIAAAIGEEYQWEKEIRHASAGKELFCPDPECQHKLVRYCYGEKGEKRIWRELKWNLMLPILSYMNKLV